MPNIYCFNALQRHLQRHQTKHTASRRRQAATGASTQTIYRNKATCEKIVGNTVTDDSRAGSG